MFNLHLHILITGRNLLEIETLDTFYEGVIRIVNDEFCITCLVLFALV